ncbi:hypothetical protein HF086_002371 [Spodoptera exigua]|uniref:Uncharacterized protein n=1 Tax=Spodoptera exigua TaxID=7107 RepID=A0A922MFZ4_SPOEX|nr:hypothetical protein HF086_002371 [Spodoptera exigua]
MRSDATRRVGPRDEWENKTMSLRYYEAISRPVLEASLLPPPGVVAPGPVKPTRPVFVIPEAGAAPVKPIKPVLVFPEAAGIPVRPTKPVAFPEVALAPRA